MNIPVANHERAMRIWWLNTHGTTKYHCMGSTSWGTHLPTLNAVEVIILEDIRQDNSLLTVLPTRTKRTRRAK